MAAAAAFTKDSAVPGKPPSISVGGQPLTPGIYQINWGQTGADWKTDLAVSDTPCTKKPDKTDEKKATESDEKKTTESGKMQGPKTP